MKTRTLRLPDDLDARIERLAEDDRRSVNAEMVLLLERSYRYGSSGHPRRPQHGPCPYCEAAEDRWCTSECPALDPMDYR